MRKHAYGDGFALIIYPANGQLNYGEAERPET